MSKLISGIIGFSIGVFLCGVTFSMVTKFGWPSAMDFLNSALVAVSLFVALHIHNSSHRQQQADRRWDINKDVLLELAHSLHEVIEATKAKIDELRQEGGDWGYGDESAIKRSTERDTNVWETLDEKIRYALNVYEPLMADSLIELIRTYQATGDRITEAVIDYGHDSLSAYEEMLKEGKELHGKLQEFIGEVSGIRKAG
jgi:hypothetical protein